MKFLALLAVVYAVDKPAGTPCTFTDGECGDAANVCCGIATGGLMCKDSTCAETVPTAPAPNLVMCNSVAAKMPADQKYIANQANAAGTKIYF